MMLNLSEKGRIKKKLCALKKRGLTFFSYCYLLFPFSEHLKLKTSECRRGFSSSFFHCFLCFIHSFSFNSLSYYLQSYLFLYHTLSIFCLSFCLLAFIHFIFKIRIFFPSNSLFKQYLLFTILVFPSFNPLSHTKVIIPICMYLTSSKQLKQVAIN